MKVLKRKAEKVDSAMTPRAVPGEVVAAGLRNGVDRGAVGSCFAENANDDWEALMATLDASQAVAIAKMRSVPPEALTQPGPQWRNRRVTIAGVIRAATRDEHDHLGQVQSLIAGEAR